MKQNYFEQRISFFSSRDKATPTANVPLHEVLFGERFKNEIEQLRNTGDPDERKRLKAALPCFTPHGTFSRRDSKHLSEPSSLVAIDIDAKDNKHVDRQLWANLSKAFDPTRHPNVLYCGKSCSGQSWWLLIPVESYNPDLHKTYFDAIVNDLAAMGLAVDKSGSDVARLRFVSCDETPYVNESAKPYRLPKTSTSLNKRHEDAAVGLIDDDSAAWAGFQLARDLQIVDVQEIDVLSSYEEWRDAAFALLSLFNPEHARELFHRFSTYYPRYSPAETDAQFDACLASQRRGGAGISIGTLFKFLREKCGALIDFQEFTNN